MKKTNSKLIFGANTCANGGSDQLTLNPDEPQNLKRSRHHVEKNDNNRSKMSIQEEIMGHA